MVDNKKKETDRRKLKRVKPRNCSVVVNSRFGEIIDISIGGVAFTYIDRGECLKGSVGIGLLHGDDDLCIDELPIRILDDCLIGEGVSVVRRCSAEFGKLSPKQINLLERLIKVSNIDNDNPDDDDFSA